MAQPNSQYALTKDYEFDFQLLLSYNPRERIEGLLETRPYLGTLICVTNESQKTSAPHLKRLGFTAVGPYSKYGPNADSNRCTTWVGDVWDFFPKLKESVRNNITELEKLWPSNAAPTSGAKFK